MPPELSADDIRERQFRAVLRGVDRAEVEEFLASVADRIEELGAEQERLAAQIGDTGARDLES